MHYFHNPSIPGRTTLGDFRTHETHNLPTPRKYPAGSHGYSVCSGCGDCKFQLNTIIYGSVA